MANSKSPSASERAGLALVRKVVVGDATFTDTGKLPNRHDWELDHEGQLVAAVEITSAQDRQRRSLAAALDKHWKWLDQVLHQPTLTKRWFVNPADDAMIGDKKLRPKLVELLEELEANDIPALHTRADEYRIREITEPEFADYFRHMQAQAKRLRALGFHDVQAEASKAATGGEIVAVIARIGAVLTDARHLGDLVAATIADPNDHDLRKLVNSGAPEGHLVVFVGDDDTFTFKGQTITAFGVVRALRTRQLPNTEVELPAGIGGIWVASLRGDYPAAAYLRDGGWQLVDTAAIWDEPQQTDLADAAPAE